MPSPKNKDAFPRMSPADNGLTGTGHDKTGITYAGQEKLPKLPIPDLEKTCRNYIRALEPLQSHREHHETKAVVEEFLKNEGPGLQEKLKKYADGRSSYIEQFWYDSYLNFDNPVVLNLNPFFLLEDDPTPARNNQVTRAASLVVSALAFIRAIRKEELPPDTVRGTPLDMFQYSRIFGTARVPTENGCQILADQHSRHIVAMCHSQLYWFDVLDDNADIIMTERDIAVNLESIIQDASKTPIQEAAKGAIGVLSTENRKIWAGLREILSREEGSNNDDCLKIVDSALFVLCLDYTSPSNPSELCMNMLAGTSTVEKGVQVGTCTNRWYDKLQIIVCQNGSAGINFEHTGVDGHTVLRMASDVYTDTILRFAKSINGQSPSMWASTSPDPSKRDPASFGDVSTSPRKLEWDMLPELSLACRFAETRLADLIHQSEIRTLEFGQYGKNFITSMGFSPDAFLQMAFQAAYYGLYGRVECTYEPAMTKAFLHGRTESIRTVTNESVDFVKKFWADVPAAEKVAALKTACEKHVAITKECAKGFGQDRHLYALFCVWQRAVDEHGIPHTESGSDGYSSPTLSDDSSRDVLSAASDEMISTNRPVHASIPAIFADSGWEKLNNTVLSTSNCGNPSLRQFGFGPTSGDGFGLGYIIKEDSIFICASSKHRQTKRFVDTIESYFLQIRHSLRQSVRKKSPAASRAREAEERRPSVRKPINRGRAIGGAPSAAPVQLQENNDEEDDDDMLGGYGFFDAGMLAAALRSANEDEEEKKLAALAAAEDARVRRRAVGRKLRLAEN